MEGHWKFQESRKSLENLNFKRRVQYYQLNFWMVLVTSTSMIGCGAIFEPPPFLCHCCNWDVQAMGACESSSSNRSFVEAQLNKKTYITWTWGPTHDCRIPPCRLCMNSKHSLLRQVRCIGQSLEYVVGHSSESYGSTCFWNKNTFGHSYTEFPRDIRHPRIVWLLTSLLGPCGGLCPPWIFPNLRYGDSFRLW